MTAPAWLITGGTGFFGREAIRQILAKSPDCKVRVFSRDERKQADLRAEFHWAVQAGRLITIIGDVRDEARVRQAVDGATYVLHAAALKRVEACQADVEEAIKTNVLGTVNVAKAAEWAGVWSAVLISSDKAANPVNSYGASKLAAEHVMLNAGRAWGPRATRLMAVRYGNVVGSRGSVIEGWRSLPPGSSVPIRDPDATRFWLTIQDGVALALWIAQYGRGCSLYVPSLKSASMGAVARAMGLVPGFTEALFDAEKKHECLLTEHEAMRATMVAGAPMLLFEVPAPTGMSKVNVPALSPPLLSSDPRRFSDEELKALVAR